MILILLETAKALNCKKYQLELILSSSKKESDLWCLGRAEGSYLWWLKHYCQQYVFYDWTWDILSQEISSLDKKIIEVNVNFAMHYENTVSWNPNAETYKIYTIDLLFTKTSHYLKLVLRHILIKNRLNVEFLNNDEKILKCMLLLNILIKNKNYIVILIKKKTIYTNQPVNLNNLNVKLPHTVGWYLIYLNSATVIHGSINKAVSFLPEKVTYLGDYSVENVLLNKNFTKNFWIPNEVYDITHADDFFLKKKVTQLDSVVNVINSLNNTRYFVQQRLLDMIKKLYNNPGIKQCLDKTAEAAAFNAIALEELTRLKNTCFFLTHQLDKRSRIYVTNIPVNYQLNKVVRGLLYSDQFNLKLTCARLETSSHFNIFIKTLTYKNYEAFLQKARAWFNTIGKAHFLPQDNTLADKILLEAALDLFKRLGKLENTTITKLERGLRLIQEIYYTPLETFLEKNFLKAPKQDFFFLICNLKDWFESNDSWPKIWWYNDASANVIQLLCWKLFVQNKFTLQVANILTNTTEFPDVYTYILYKLQNTCIPKYASLLSRELIKSRIMPGAYGQLFLTFYSIANTSFLEKENNELAWSSSSKEERVEFLRWVDTSIWTNLAAIDLDILNFLKLCRYVGSAFWTKCTWFNYAGLPVIIYKKKIFNRNNAQNRLKKAFALNTKFEHNYRFFDQVLTDNPEFWKYSPLKLIEKLSMLRIPTAQTSINEKNNSKLNQILEFNKKILLSEKENLQKDEKNYTRKNIKYKLTMYTDNKPTELVGYIKIRIQKKTGDLDILNLKNNIAASSTHADDASILIKTSEYLNNLNIPHSTIHDSIGSPLEFSPIIKFFFKHECAEYQEYVLKNYTFPFNILNNNFLNPELEFSRKNFMELYEKNRTKTLNNLQKFKQEIIESQNLFS